MKTGAVLALGAVVVLTGMGSAGFSQQRNAPERQPEPLWSGSAPLSQGTSPDDIPTLTAYLPATNPTRTAVVIAPGGGYQHLAMDHEGRAVAQWLNERGVAAFVLKYRLGPRYHHPAELDDVLRALRLARSEADAGGFMKIHVVIWGFSAGGHLAASAATLDEPGHPDSVDPVEREASRPDFAILAYPVITFKDPYAHAGSRKNLLGDQPSPDLVDHLSLEGQVNAQTPPTFLFATTDDPVVPVMNSVLFYSALVKAHVPAEMHLFEHGGHGVGLAPNDPILKQWPELLSSWMVKHGWMQPQN